MYKWVIFDMDWLLIDSEPLWQLWEIEVFSKYWIKIDPLQTTWMKINEFVKYWYEIYKWDLSIVSLKELEIEILNKMVDLFDKQIESLPWVVYILEYFKKKWYKIAINSASDYILIKSVIKKLSINKYIEILHSWEDEDLWKPHPWWYLSTCSKMWLQPSEVIAFEDSFNWCISVKAAKIKCVCIPDRNDYDNPKFNIGDVKLHSLNDFNDTILETL